MSSCQCLQHEFIHTVHSLLLSLLICNLPIPASAVRNLAPTIYHSFTSLFNPSAHEQEFQNYQPTLS